MIKRTLLAVLCAGALAASGFVPAVAAEDPKPPRKIVSGWMPYWSTKASLDAITSSADLYGEVNVFWFSVKSSTQIINQYAQSSSTPMPTTIAALKAQGVKVFATFTDGTGKLAMQGILKDSAQRTRLVQTLTTFVLANGFDGIDLDFEGFAFTDGSTSWPTTQPLWTTFITELSASLKAQNLMLSVTTPEVRDPASGKRGYWVYDWAGIAPFIDRLRIMTYDYSVARVGPIGPITWAETTVKYATTLVSPSKIYVGVATYGRDWVVGLTGTCPTNVNLVPQTATVNGTRATVLSNSAVALATAYGTAPAWNAQYAESTFTYRKTYSGKKADGTSTSCTATRTVWYQDGRSALERAKLVGKYRLGGIAMWYISQEEAGTAEPVRTYARSISPDKVTLALSAPTASSRYGSVMNLKGTLAISDGRPVAGGEVILQSQVVGESAWTDLATAITSVDGGISFDVIAGRPRVFRLTSAATWERYAGQSADITPALRRMVQREAPLVARRKLAFPVTGTITPVTADVPIAIQLLSSGTWRTVAKGTTAADGTYTIKVLPSGYGPALYRVLVQPAAGFGRTYAPPMTVLVR